MPASSPESSRTLTSTDASCQRHASVALSRKTHTLFDPSCNHDLSHAQQDSMGHIHSINCWTLGHSRSTNPSSQSLQPLPIWLSTATSLLCMWPGDAMLYSICSFCSASRQLPLYQRPVRRSGRDIVASALSTSKSDGRRSQVLSWNMGHLLSSQLPVMNMVPVHFSLPLTCQYSARWLCNLHHACTGSTRFSPCTLT